MTHTNAPVLSALLLMACPKPLVGGESTDAGADEVGGSSSTTTSSSFGESTETGEAFECGGQLSEVECVDGKCDARWTGTDAWSNVFAASVVATWSPISPVQLFPCEPDPTTLDGCAIIDDVGHVACWVWEGECARLAAPLCSVKDAIETDVWPDWMPCDGGLSIGATALCEDQFCWLSTDPTTSIHPRC